MRAAILTSRAAEELVGEVLRDYRGNMDIDVVALPVPAISVLTTSAAAAIVASRPELRERLKSSDMIIVPGLMRGSGDEIARVVGKPVVKGPRILGALPAVLRYVEQGVALSPDKSAEEVLGELRPRVSFEEYARVGGVPIALRGPPLALLAEVHPGVPEGSVASETLRMVQDGADIIVVGAVPSMDPRELGRRVREALLAGRPVIAEAPTRAHAEEALSAGASGLSVEGEMGLELIEEGASPLVIVGDSRLEVLREAERLSGRVKIIADPSLAVPPLGLVDSLVRFRQASAELSVPLLFSAANVSEDVEADTAGVHALLALMGVELRASAYLVVEETYKSHRSTAEAREALRLAEEAFVARSTERGSFSRLLMLKQQYEPPEEPLEQAEQVGYVEPNVRPDEYVQILVSHRRGTIAVRLVRGGKAVLTLEGRHALSIARELVRRAGLNQEHAAYVGYELAKAEEALRLGKTYVQDEPVIETPWERGANGVRKC